MLKKALIKGMFVPLLVVFLLTGCLSNNFAPSSETTSEPATSESSSSQEKGTTIEIPEPEKTDLTLRLNWKFKGEFTPFFVAKEKGYFEKYGLNVEVLEGNGSSQVMQVISQQNDDFGVTSTVEPSQGLAEGMPVQMIASYMNHSPIMILSHPDQPVKTPKDLEGKKIAMSTASTFTNVYDKFLEVNGVDAAKVESVKLESSARNVTFLNKDVDAVAVFSTNEYPVFEKELGVELQPLYLGDFGYDLSGLTLVSNTKFLKENPNATKRFLAAINEAFQYTIENPEESASIVKGLFPETVDEEIVIEQINRTAELADPSGNAYGWISEENIENTLNILEESGLLSVRKELDEYFTNEYLPANE